MTIVALDAMGGDHAPKTIVQGTLLAARDPSIEIALVGRTGELHALMPAPPANVHLVDAPDTVGMDERGATAVRQKPRSSITVGLELVKSGDAQAFLSFGNTGAVMAAALLTLGRVRGVSRPALGALFHNARGAQSLLLDVGANMDCKPAYLAQFATMGKAYFERVLHHRNPSVALLNVGQEESKGNGFTREAYHLLRRDEPNFTGNVEGDGLVAGEADVIVTDGFNGNVVLKLSEGVMNLVTAELGRTVRGKWHYLLAAWLLRGALRGMQERTDYRAVGGAPLFGVSGAVMIGHGRADAETVAAGIRSARAVGESEFVETIRRAFGGAPAAAAEGPARPGDGAPASSASTPAPRGRG